MPKVHETRFPVTSPQTGKLPTCYGVAAVLLHADNMFINELIMMMMMMIMMTTYVRTDGGRWGIESNLILRSINLLIYLF